MSKADKELLDSLRSQQGKLEEVARMLPSVREETERLSKEIGNVIFAVTNSAAELHDIHVGVQTLQLQAERKFAALRCPKCHT